MRQRRLLSANKPGDAKDDLKITQELPTLCSRIQSASARPDAASWSGSSRQRTARRSPQARTIVLLPQIDSFDVSSEKANIFLKSGLRTHPEGITESWLDAKANRGDA